MSEQKTASLDEQLKQQQANQGARVNHVAIVVSVLVVVLLIAMAFLFSVSNEPDVTKDDSVATVADLTAKASEQTRQHIQEAILAFEEDYQGLLNNQQLSSFAPRLIQQAKFTYDSSLQAFAQSDFATAQQQLESSAQFIDEAQSQWRKAVDSWYMQALDSMTQQRPKEAQLYLDRMRSLDEQDRRIDALQQRIDQFDSQRTLLKEYETAVIERNLEKQITTLSQLVVLTPEPQEYQSKLSAAEALMRERKISQAVELGQQALQQQNLAQAQSSINTLMQLQAAPETIKLLQQQLAKQQRQLSTERTRALALAASEQQQWQQVLTLTQQYLDSAPGDTAITQLQQRAKAILSAQNSLAVYQARPERMIDSGIRTQAQNAIMSAKVLEPHSHALATTIKDLEVYIERYSTPVSVTLLSDENTQVHIYGVEKLGPFAKKQIQLLPGTYTVEGRRTGYVSVKHTLEVSAQGAMPPLTIACTQRI
ncbi:hypothetical protein [Pseudoalteromonas pernae]|uniref:hypothetical protein n=1 Tax=Pseudoalteromonas pernae TaxID=3118054 RepID=UPI0032428524